MTEMKGLKRTTREKLSKKKTETRRRLKYTEMFRGKDGKRKREHMKAKEGERTGGGTKL